VTDGFTGNVLLKSIQGTAKAVMDWMKEEATHSLLLKILLGLTYPLLKRIKNKSDYDQTGGAPLLGVNKTVVIAHGSSKEKAIKQAILFAKKAVDEKIIPTFNETLKVLLEKSAAKIKTIQPAPTVAQQVQL
jgi:glycerol-3-phosphate acyltransferase PlsX